MHMKLPLNLRCSSRLRSWLFWDCLLNIVGEREDYVTMIGINHRDLYSMYSSISTESVNFHEMLVTSGSPGPGSLVPGSTVFTYPVSNRVDQHSCQSWIFLAILSYSRKHASKITDFISIIPGCQVEKYDQNVVDCQPPRNNFGILLHTNDSENYATHNYCANQLTGMLAIVI